MINRIIAWSGNLVTISVASIASISADDFRLWGIAVIGVGATLWASIQRTHATKIAIIREEVELCGACKRTGVIPNPCPRKLENRPKDCLLKGDSK